MYDFVLLEADHPRLHAFTRTLDGVRLCVRANLSGEPLELAGLDLPDTAEDAVLLANHGDAAAGADRLRPWEVVVSVRR